MLTSKEIQLILQYLSEEIIVEPFDKFPYTISKRGFGYSKNSTVGALQAKLSIMLEVAMKREKGS